MLQSFTVRNFRTFRDLTVEPLKRVNLIAGKNNVGKTALLEALYLASGPNVPELTVQIAQLRRLDVRTSSGEEVWSGLFYGRQIENPIELISSNAGHGEKTLRVSLKTSNTAYVAPAGASSSAPSGIVPLTKEIPGVLISDYTDREIVLDYQDGANTVGSSRAWLHRRDDQMVITTERAALPPPSPAHYISATHGDFVGLPDLYTNAIKTGKEETLLTSLRLLEPRLTRLALLMMGRTPMIHGDIGIGSMLPIALMGGGTGRLLMFLLAISNTPDGMILIDEVENGFHHSVLVDVWRAINTASKQSNTQIFATTHSYECIHAAQEAFARDREAEDLRLIRLDRIDGNIQAVNYKTDVLEAAIEMGVEVR